MNKMFAFSLCLLYAFVLPAIAGPHQHTPAEAALISSASSDIAVGNFLTFCSTLLGYSAPVTVTEFDTVSLEDHDSTVGVFPTETTYVTAYSTLYITNNLAKRSDVSSTSEAATGNGPRAATPISTPAVLTKYPASIVTEACSENVFPQSPTSTTHVPTFTTYTTRPLTVTMAQFTSVPIATGKLSLSNSSAMR